MQDQDEEIRQLIRKGLTEDEIVYYLKNKSKFGQPQTQAPKVEEPKKEKNLFEKFGYDPASGASASGKLAETAAKGLRQADRAAQFITRNEGGILGRAVRGSAEFLEKRAGELEKETQEINPDPTFTQRVDRTIANFIGQSVPYMATGTAISRAITPVVEGVVAKTVGGALAKTAASEAAKTAIVRGISAAPAQALGVAAIDGPETLATPLGAGSVLFGSALEGLAAFRGNLQNIKTLVDDPTSPVSSKDLVAEVDKFKAHFDKLVGKEVQLIPSSRPTPTPSKAKIEIETPFTPKSWNPRNRGRNHIPIDEEVDYFAEEARKLYAKRSEVLEKIEKKLGKLKVTYSEKTMKELADLEEEAKAIQSDYDEFVAPYLHKAASEQAGLKFVKGTDHLSTVRFRDNNKPNFPNPLERPTTPRVTSISQQVDEQVDLLTKATKPLDNVAAPKPFLNPFEKAIFHTQNRALPFGKISKDAEDVLNNLGATSREAQLAISSEMSLPVMDGNGKWNGTMTPVKARPLGQIIADAKKFNQYEGLERVIQAKRTILDPKKSEMKLEDAHRIIGSADPALLSLSNEYDKVLDWMVDYTVGFGRMTKAQGQQLKQALTAPFSPTKEIPSLEQTARQVFQVIERSKKNYAYSRLIDDFEKNRSNFLGLIEPAPQPAVDVIEKRTAEIVTEKGLERAYAKKLAELELGGSLDPTDGNLIIFRGGQPYKYKIDPTLAKAVESFHPMEKNILLSTLSALSTPLREGTAAALDMSGLGPLSDAVSASAFDPGFRFFLDPLKGAWHTLLKTGEYKQAVGAGMGFGARFRPDSKILPSSNLVQKITSPIKLVGDGFEGLNNFLRPISNASRMGLYLSQIRQGRTPLEASTQANNILGNWNKVGASLRGWARATEFGNVGIQSQAAMASAIKRAATDPKAAASLIGVGISTITLPTIYFLVASEGDEEIQALRKADNYTFWYSRNDDGTISKMRKPGWMLAPVFGSSVEMVYDGLDGASKERMIKSILNEVGFNSMPVTIQTLIGLANNSRNPIFGGITGQRIPIIPMAQLAVDPAAQGGPNTSVLAKNVGELTNTSPFNVDFVLDRFLSTTGANILRMPQGRMDGRRDVPIFSRFSVSPYSQTEGSKQFYDDLEKAKNIDMTFKKLPEDKREAWLAKHEGEIGYYRKLAPVAQAIGQINEMIRMISQDPKIDKEEKQKLIQEHRDKITTFFIEYSKNYDEIKKTNTASK